MFSLDSLLHKLVEPESRDCLETTEFIYTKSDSKLLPEVKFLRSFRNLRRYEGLVKLTHPNDIDYLRNLEYSNLQVDINNVISDAKLLLPLVKFSSRIRLINLPDAGDFGVEIYDGHLRFFQMAFSHGDKIENICQWFPLLTSEHVRVVELKFYVPCLINNLPPNIEVLVLGSEFTSNDVRSLEPKHPISVKGALKLDEKCLRLSPKISGFNCRITSHPLDVIRENPHLKEIGFEIDHSCYTLRQIIDIIKETFSVWNGYMSIRTKDIAIHHALEAYFTQDIESEIWNHIIMNFV